MVVVGSCMTDLVRFVWGQDAEAGLREGVCSSLWMHGGLLRRNRGRFGGELQVPPARRVPDGVQEVGNVCQVREHCGQGAENARMVLDAPPKPSCFPDQAAEPPPCVAQ